jgi:hypothetical protein
MATAPEDWIAREVRVGTEVGRAIIGTLEEVNDRGVVLQYEMGGDEGEHPMFLPWRVVNWVYPTSEPSEPGDRRPATSARPAEVPEEPVP